MPRKKKVVTRRKTTRKTTRQAIVAVPTYTMPAPSAMTKIALWVGILTTLLGGVSTIFYASPALYNLLPFVSGLSQLSWTLITIVGLVLTYYSTKRQY